MMRDMFGEEEYYYNMVFSDEELDIEPGRIYGVTTKKDIEMAADVFIVQMQGMIYAGVIVVYLVINQLLVGRLNKVNQSEVLKNRE